MYAASEKLSCFLRGIQIRLRSWGVTGHCFPMPEVAATQLIVIGVEQHTLLFGSVCEGKKFVYLVLLLVEGGIHAVAKIIGV
jgi:hypothetical protein